MVSSVLSAELAATCSALGYSDGSKYYIDRYCKETVKDLIRYLRHDDENHEIRRFLGEAKVLVTDLLPIIKHYHDDEELFDVVLRLLVNLTNPALLLYREELPADKSSRKFYLQIISQLQGYKDAFSDESIWATLSKHLSEILQIGAEERSEESAMVLERILVLIRNVLQVPADPEAERRPDNDASIHDQVLWALHQSGIVDLILYMSNTQNEQAYFMHNLEIVSLMLRDQVASELASTTMDRSVQEKERDETELLLIRQREVQERHTKTRQYTGARHSRFGGTFVLNNVKSISDNDLILYKPVSKVDSLTHSDKKSKMKKPKNKMPMQGDGLKRRSAFSVRLFLKEFCVEFLNGSYNRLMHYVKDCLARGVAQPNDESFYLWSIKFFMEFNRSYKLQVKLVSETMNIQCFHWVQSQLEHCHGMMASDKKKLLVWSRRMHLALRAYQELLLYLAAMESSPEKTIRDSAQVIQGNLFYLVEYRELLLTLIHAYDEVKMSRSYLKDLVETLHVFMKLMERFCRKQRGIVVQQKGVRKRPKKPKKSTPAPAPPRQKSTEELWDEVSAQLSVVLGSGLIPDDVVPFDAASEKDIDEQKEDAMRRIHSLLKHHQYEEAVGLMRAAREVWPENDCFGNAHMAPEEEFAALREVFFANITQDAEVERADAERQQDDHNEEEEENEEEDDEEGGSTSYREQELQFSDFVKRVVHSKAVQAASHLLQQFDRNSAYTNHCVAKLLHRIAWEASCPGILYQASLFRSFQRIMRSKLAQHQELAKLAQFVVRKFSAIAEKNPLVYVELLFWKTAKDAIEVEEGYGSYQAPSAASKKMWKEEEEDELRLLYQEFQRDEPGGDVVDWILGRLINQNRTKHGVKKKLQELFLLVPKTKAPKQWGEDEIAQLTELYDRYRGSGDVMENILSHLRVKRPKPRVIDKLLELGLVSERKELYKKGGRGKSGSMRREGWESDRSGTSDEEDKSDEDTPSKRGKKKEKKKERKKKDNSNRDRVALKKARRAQTGRAPASQVTAMLLQVISSGMTGGLQWLKESLTEAADDLAAGDDQDSEGVPLLPIEEDAVAAMDSPLFQRLLQALGIVPPFDEQEMYWRIPGDMKAAELTEKASVIERGLEGKLSADVESDTEEMDGAETNDRATSSNSRVDDSSGSEDEFTALRRITAKQDEHQDAIKANVSLPSESTSSQSQPVKGSVSEEQTKKKHKRVKQVVSDSDEDASPELETSEAVRDTQMSRFDSDTDDDDGTSSGSKVVKGPRKHVLLDSDSENDDAAVSENMSSQIQKRPVVDSDSESDAPAPEANGTKVSVLKSSPLKESSILNGLQERRKLVSSDDEMEADDTILSRGKGKKRMLSSSDGSGDERKSPAKERNVKLTKLRV